MSEEMRTYGGWRRRRGIGLFGLGPAGTLTVLGGLVALILLAAVSPGAALVAAPVLGAAGALGFARHHGEPLVALLARRGGWWWAVRRGTNRYRAGVVVAHYRAFDLPGVLAPTRLLSAEDGRGGRYGLVWDRRTGHLTVTLLVTPASTWLADRADADTWVANWGAWLASLGHLPALKWVTVTVDTAPEAGCTLTDTVTSHLDPTAPRAAIDLMGQFVDHAPAAAADVHTQVSVTFDPSADPAQPKDLTHAVAEIGRTVTAMAGSLEGCGLTVARTATAADLAGTVRMAYDPAARGDVTRILDHQHDPEPCRHLGWGDAGPVHAVEHPDRYEHENAVSVVWAWHQAPQHAVTADVLARLLTPATYNKRVTLQYRPFPAQAATRVLENEVNAATFRRHYRYRTGRDETARDAYDTARAQQAASEEALGAGVTLISLYTTATVTDPADLPAAITTTENAAGTSKIRLRRLWGSQAAGFATTLPCGIYPPELKGRLS
jgi:hypothetical protein